jgi:hypothetical protein
MKGIALLGSAAAIALLCAGTAISSTRAATLCVGNQPSCFPTLQAAVDAAQDGDTIQIRPGTYAGGVTIEKSVRLKGAGAQSTIIRGGGPVVTIGTFFSSTQPTVSIDGVTITGGVTRSSDIARNLFVDGQYADGGGVEIEPGIDRFHNADVTISNSVIEDNLVAPTVARPDSPDCPGGPCPRATARGGGISAWGTLTLVNSTVRDNRIGAASGLPGSSVTSDAFGGGIFGARGPLTIKNSTIEDNATSAVGPNGLYVWGGGIDKGGVPTFSMSNSTVTGNTATLDGALPDGVEGFAFAGGIYVEDATTAATISNGTITGNSATMTNTTASDANAYSGGLQVDFDVPFQLSNSTVSDNSVFAMTLPGSQGAAGADSAAGEMHGTIENSRLTENTLSVSSAASDAFGQAGASILYGTVSNTLVQGNHVQVSSPDGAAFSWGGGLVAEDTGMTLSNTRVSDNGAEAVGQTASALGGGVSDTPDSGPLGGPLTLQNSSITGNQLTGSAGATLQGGGVYSCGWAVTLDQSRVERNQPDQLFACPGPLAPLTVGLSPRNVQPFERAVSMLGP